MLPPEIDVDDSVTDGIGKRYGLGSIDCIAQQITREHERWCLHTYVALKLYSFQIREEIKLYYDILFIIELPDRWQ